MLSYKIRFPTTHLFLLEEQCPPRLQVLSRAVVRGGMRAALLARHPHLREPPPRDLKPANACPRRICIPVEDDSDVGKSSVSLFIYIWIT